MDVNSAAKFASITPDLVVRKGEAKPWPQYDAAVRSPSRTARDEDPLEADEIVSEPQAVQDGIRRCTLRLTPCEYERLGIIAVKRDTSRQQILRLAVEEYLAAIEHEYGKECGCLGGRTCRTEKPRQGPRTF
jgi:hypothetical protein